MSRLNRLLLCFPALCYSGKDKIIKSRNEFESLDASIHGNAELEGGGEGEVKVELKGHISIDEQTALVIAAENTPSHVNYKNTVKFVPPITEGVVVKVYDGDTITVASKLPYPESPMYRFQVRLNGIDAPEIKGSNEDEKLAAVYAKNEMIHLVMNKTVQLRNVDTEKYGRLLADVYVGELHVNGWMLDNKLVVPYDGGTKKSPESWIKYQQRDEHDSDHSF